MRIAHNPQTGEYLGLRDGQWEKLRIAENSAGDRLYLGENGWEPLNTGGAMTPDKPRGDEKSWGERAAHSLGVGTRDVLEGVGEIAGMFVTPFANAASWALGGRGDEFRNPGAAAADWMGLPKAESDSEKLASAVIRGGAGAIGSVGLGAAPAVARAAPQVGKFLSSGPLSQISGSMAASAGAEAAEQAGGGTAVQTVAGLAGGMVPPAAGLAGQLSWRGLRAGLTAFDALSDAGRERIAGQTLARISGAPEEVRNVAANAVQYLEGSSPTLAQATGNASLAVLEKGLASSGPQGAAIGERYAQQRQARQTLLDDTLNGAADRLAGEREGLNAAVQHGIDAGTAGDTLRSAYDRNYAAARARTRAAYDAIDPEGTASFDLRPILEKFGQTIGDSPFEQMAVPGQVRQFMGIMGEMVKNGQNGTYRDLQAMRTALADMGETAGRSGDAATARLAGNFKRTLDDYMERLAADETLQGGFPYPQPGSPAYKEATRLAREGVKSDPMYDDLRYLYQNGLNRDAVERIVGRAGVETLNTQYPGLVRPSGKLTPDQVAGDLGGSTAYGYGGTETSARDSQAMMELILDRLQGGGGRINADVAKVRDQIIAGNTRPHTGFDLEQAEAFMAAKRQRREQGRLFEQGQNLALSRRGKELEGRAVDNAKIAGRYFRKGPAGRESMRAFYNMAQDDPEALQAMLDYARGELRRAAVKTDGTLDPAKLARFQKDHAAALEMLPEMQMEARRLSMAARGLAGRESGLKTVARKTGDVWKLNRGVDVTGDAGRRFGVDGMGTFTGQELEALDAVQRDMARAARADSLAAVKGSPTAQNLATQAILDAFVGGDFWKHNPQGAGGFWRNAASVPLNAWGDWLGKWLYGGSADAINQLLINAMLDPAEAARLMGKRQYVPKRSIGEIFGNSGRAAGNVALRNLANTYGGLLGEFARSDRERR